jgi:phosphate/sulfate permease
VLGSIIGFGTVKVGLSALNLDTLKRTVASWFLSPCLGGLVSYSIYWALKRWVLMSHDVVDRARLSAHLLFALTIAVDVVFVLVAGPASMRQSSSTVFILFILSYVVSLAFSIYAMKPFLGVMSATKALLYRLLPADLRAKVRSFFDSKQPSDNINLIHPSRVNSGDIEMSTDVSSDVSSQSGGDSLPVETIIDLDDKEIQNNFRPAMIMAACAVALAHGANDVANALGPYFTIYSLYKDGHVGTEKAASMPLGLSIAGGIGIVIGLALWSAPVMRTIGESLTKLTFAKGFCAQFGGSVTVLLATYLGLPISTSAVLVGCVTGVGMVDGWGNIDLKLFLSIVGGWFVTLPITAVFSATIFVILYWMAV